MKTDWKKSIIRKEKLIQVHSDGQKQTPKIGKAHFFDGPIDIKIGPIIKLVRFSRELHFARVLKMVSGENMGEKRWLGAKMQFWSL